MKTYSKFLNEKKHRTQLMIPFDNKHSIHDKPVFLHVEDALLDLTKGINQNQYFHSNQNVEEIFEDEGNKSEAFQMYGDISDMADDNAYSIAGFIDRNHPSDHPEYWKTPEKFIDVKDGADVVFDVNISKELTEEGLKRIKEYKRELFEDNLDDEGFTSWVYGDSTYHHCQDDDGLVTIYRAVTFEKGEFEDPYENIMDHKGVGFFWTWDREMAIPHWGRGGELFTLCAKTKPEEVDWIQTIYKNGYDLNREHEIEMKGGGVVQVISMKNREGKEYKLEKPLIVPC